jgi:hypothetical protein
MGLFAHQNQRIDILEVECSMLGNLAMKLQKESLSTTFNNRASNIFDQVEVKGDETIHQVKELMDIKQ